MKHQLPGTAIITVTGHPEAVGPVEARLLRDYQLVGEVQYAPTPGNPQHVDVTLEVLPVVEPAVINPLGAMIAHYYRKADEYSVSGFTDVSDECRAIARELEAICVAE